MTDQDVLKIILCDLTHTAQTISSEFMPYAAGCVAAYLKPHIKQPLDIHVFKFMKDLEEEIAKGKPKIVAFSHYMWNSDLSLKVAQIIKKVYPDVVVIFGGPHFPVEVERQKEWIKNNKQVDFYIPFEGEKPFCKLVEVLIKEHCLTDRVKKEDIPGVISCIGDNFNIIPSNDRLKTLDELPSPYLLGYLDQYFETSLWPIVETNRGCPFQCAFCLEGNRYFSHVCKRSPEATKEEFLYIAKKDKRNSMVFVADSNFLMFKEDLEICKFLNYTQEKYGWPTFIGCSTGKNKKELVLEGARLLSGKITVAASVQSLDEQVLKNIRRDNISQEQLLGMVNDIQRSGGISYSELIACLPGDSVKTHFSSMAKLVSSGISIIKHHTLLLLEGSYLASQEARDKFGFKTMWRVVTKSFGDYSFINNDFSSIEFEEVVVTTDALSFYGYLSCRKIGLVIHYFYNDSVFEEVHKLLKYFDIPIWDWLVSIYEAISDEDSPIKVLCDEYLAEVQAELWPSKEELIAHINEYMSECLAGKRGSNLTFKYRALLHKYHVKDAFEVGFKHLKKVIQGEDSIEHNVSDKFLEQLKQFCILRKEDIFDNRKDVKQCFDFDFRKFDCASISSDIFSRNEDAIAMDISHSKEQKDFIEEYFKTHAQDNIIDLASLLNRVPAKTMYRSVLTL